MAWAIATNFTFYAYMYEEALVQMLVNTDISLISPLQHLLKIIMKCTFSGPSQICGKNDSGVH
jgi:hypothetical protein